MPEVKNFWNIRRCLIRWTDTHRRLSSPVYFESFVRDINQSINIVVPVCIESDRKPASRHAAAHLIKFVVEYQVKFMVLFDYLIVKLMVFAAQSTFQKVNQYWTEEQILKWYLCNSLLLHHWRDWTPNKQNRLLLFPQKQTKTKNIEPICCWSSKYTNRVLILSSLKQKIFTPVWSQGFGSSILKNQKQFIKIESKYY